MGAAGPGSAQGLGRTLLPLAAGAGSALGLASPGHGGVGTVSTAAAVLSE